MIESSHCSTACRLIECKRVFITSPVFHRHACVAADSGTVALKEQRWDGRLVISSFACLWQKRGPFSIFTECVVSKRVLRLHLLFSYETMRSAWNKSAAVVPVRGRRRLGCSLSLLLFNHSSLALMRTDHQSWEEGWSVCVCGGHLFFSSLPPSLVHVAVREVRVQRSERRKCNCQWCSLLLVSR